MDDPRPATAAPADLLLELLYDVRRALEQRGEAPRGEWIEETAAELRSGRMPGWFYPPQDGGGISFYSGRAARAYGHVHVAGAPGAGERAERLMRAMARGLPGAYAHLDVGVTGLPPEEEASLDAALAKRPEVERIERWAMDREIGPADGQGPRTPPPGLRSVAVREVTLEALVDLDLRAFQGTVDESLLGSDPDEYRRIFTELLDGRLGPFLDAGSVAVVDEPGTRLVAALLTAERSPRQAIFLDVMVDPGHRRAGIGRWLVEWGCRALWALGYASVRLWVTRTNAPARALYERSGFRRVATAAIYRWSNGAAPAQPQAG